MRNGTSKLDTVIYINAGKKLVFPKRLCSFANRLINIAWINTIKLAINKLTTGGIAV